MKPQALINYRETKDQVNIFFKKPSLRYLDQFIGLKCASDLISTKFFPNAKEITESMGAFNAVQRNLWNVFHPSDETVECYIIGDGSKPRTGALFAYRTKWKIVSIDPNMLRNKLELGGIAATPKRINRLYAYRNYIEDLTFYEAHNNVLIVCVHSHAKLSDCFHAFPWSKKYIVNMPCCVPPDIDRQPDVCYTDWAVHSEKRNIEIYKGL